MARSCIGAATDIKVTKAGVGGPCMRRPFRLSDCIGDMLIFDKAQASNSMRGSGL